MLQPISRGSLTCNAPCVCMGMGVYVCVHERERVNAAGRQALGSCLEWVSGEFRQAPQQNKQKFKQMSQSMT